MATMAGTRDNMRNGEARSNVKGKMTISSPDKIQRITLPVHVTARAKFHCLSLLEKNVTRRPQSSVHCLQGHQQNVPPFCGTVRAATTAQLVASTRQSYTLVSWRKGKKCRNDAAEAGPRHLSTLSGSSQCLSLL